MIIDRSLVTSSSSSLARSILGSSWSPQSWKASSERFAVWLCSSPSARHAALTSSGDAAVFDPRVERVMESSSPGPGSRP